MEGILTFSKGLLCKKEVLGESFNTKIGNLDVRITFPTLKLDDEGNPLNKVGQSNALLPPPKARNYRRGEESLFWGCPLTYPDYDSVVKIVFIEHECESTLTSSNAQILYSNMGIWEEALFKYCFLRTKQYYMRKNTNNSQGAFLDILSNGKHIENQQPMKVHVLLHSHDDFASKEIITDGIEFASSGRELLLEYELLLSAYNAIQNNQNRQAIIDGSAAIEICLIKVIELFCEEKSINPHILINKYKYLGDRFDLVKMIDDTLPKLDYKKLIVGPRNSVSHVRDITPSNDVVNDFIRAVEILLEHYHSSYY